MLLLLYTTIYLYLYLYPSFCLVLMIKNMNHPIKSQAHCYDENLTTKYEQSSQITSAFLGEN